MAKDVLKKEIISIFSDRLGWKTQTVRDQISRFKINECQGCTQNGAAYLLGLIKGIKIWRKLEEKDKEKLPKNVSEIIEKYKNPKFIKEDKKIIVVKETKEKKPYNFPLSKFNIDKELVKDCKLIKPYRACIREALLTLETRIKDKLKVDKTGKALIQECKQRGVFNRQNKSEEEGLFFLFVGVILWLRNPPSHKKLEYDKEEATKIILFTDHLINLFNKLCVENNI